MKTALIQPSKWKFRSTSPNQIIEFISYTFQNKDWKINWSKQSFTGLGPEDRCSSWRLWHRFRKRMLVICFSTFHQSSQLHLEWYISQPLSDYISTINYNIHGPVISNCFWKFFGNVMDTYSIYNQTYVIFQRPRNGHFSNIFFNASCYADTIYLTLNIKQYLNIFLSFLACHWLVTFFNMTTVWFL